MEVHSPAYSAEKVEGWGGVGPHPLDLLSPPSLGDAPQDLPEHPAPAEQWKALTIVGNVKTPSRSQHC